MRLVLYQPDIPQNAGTILRLAACLGVGVDVVEPAGFVWSEPRMRRAGMDYLEFAAVTRHASWEAFRKSREGDAAAGRLVLLSTQAETPYTAFAFRENDTLLFGRESAGVPRGVHEAADARRRVGGEEVGGGAAPMDAAGFEEQHLVDGVAHEAHGMGDQHHRHAAPGQRADDLQHLLRGFWVQRRGRLVKEHDPGLQAQRAGDRHALGLAAGERRRTLVGMRRQAHLL